MEPNLPAPVPSPEVGRPRNIELSRSAEHGLRPPESAVSKEAAPERGETVSNSAQEPIDIPALPQAQMLPQLQPAPAATVSPLGDAPLAAADEDLIEKEWVDKAKKIVIETKSDPYNQEDQVSRLQADYIKKRYGKDIALNNK